MSRLCFTCVTFVWTEASATGQNRRMLTYTPEAEAFRKEVKSWLVANLPKGWFDKGFELSGDERKKFNAEWPSKLFEGGWICATWPKEYGGKGLDTLQGVVE